MPTCPLCQTPRSALFARDKSREYFRCPACRLVFVRPEAFLSPDEEKRRYDLHQNSIEDAGYRKYLERLTAPLAAHLKPGARGLDFGSGPTPVLSVLLRESGYDVVCYDPFYAAEPNVLEKSYDFITACEVIEHLKEPAGELKRLWNALKPGGILGILTQLIPEDGSFARWHYTNDRTHICFYSRETFLWLGQKLSARLEVTPFGAILLLKGAAS